tara:strand:+ start:313 stop:564 length:252 start_codon:yes stop_codon:yes gene_type:complete
MYNTLVAILTWLAGDPAQIDTLQPRAAACSQIAYSTCVREPMIDDTIEEEDEGEQPGGGTASAQPAKRKVIRCVNGRCVITYE